MDTLYITRHSATGIFGYRLLQDQAVIMNNSSPVLPERQPALSTDLKTDKTLTTFPIPISEYPTVFPGLRIGFDVHDDAGGIIAVFTKIYSDLFNAKVAVSIEDKVVFTYYSKPRPEFYNSKNELIAQITEDTTFKYDPLSTDDKRYTLLLNPNECMDILPLIFHTFISDKLGVLG